jgi:hypothetical protein
MNGFERVTIEAFDAAIAASPSSEAFKKQVARFSLGLDDPCLVHRGPLTVAGHFRAPGYCTLVVGDLTVDGLVDLTSPEGFDGNGVFIALGNVTCRAFNNDWGKVTLIDGNLAASELVISCYDDSTLVVTRDLKTRFFYGRGIWAEVGGVAEMEYGKGHCLPIGYRNAAQEAIRPRHDAETSMALLTVVENGALIEYELVDKLKQGQPVFK